MKALTICQTVNPPARGADRDTLEAQRMREDDVLTRLSPLEERRRDVTYRRACRLLWPEYVRVLP